MRIPVMRGLIERRILVNFHIDPGPLARLLPAPFRPQLVHGLGMAGICLIRLAQMRPRLLPGCVGLWSENAAHRIAVEWNENGQRRHGVYIPRRDTSSRLNAWLGGWLFPGIHHHARFQVRETAEHYSVILDSDDHQTHLAVAGRLAQEMPTSSVFGTLDEASRFFQSGSVGYSATQHSDRFDGLELQTFNWNLRPLSIERVESSFFEDRTLFPAGTVGFDSALLMQQVEHVWASQPDICCRQVTPAVLPSPELAPVAERR